MTRQSANGMKIPNKYLRLTSREGLKGQVTALEPKKKKVKKRYRDRERAGWKKERRRRKKG